MAGDHRLWTARCFLTSKPHSEERTRRGGRNRGERVLSQSSVGELVAQYYGKNCAGGDIRQLSLRGKEEGVIGGGEDS